MATSKQLILYSNSNSKNISENIKKDIIEARGNVYKINEEINIDSNSLAFIKDSNNKEFYVVTPQTMESILRLTKDLEIDKYLFELEKEIYKNAPIDFEDIWCIAIREIKDYKKDPKIIVKNIKKKYPYLFLSFGNLMKNMEL